MKALSVRQPFAHAIVTGSKTVENRTWATDYRGWIAIHAGAKRPLQIDINYLSEVSKFKCPGLYDCSAVVGLAMLVDCVHRNDYIEEKPIDKASLKIIRKSMMIDGPFLWLFSKCVLFKKSIPLKGKLKVFDADIDKLIKDYL